MDIRVDGSNATMQHMMSHVCCVPNESRCDLSEYISLT